MANLSVAAKREVSLPVAFEPKSLKFSKRAAAPTSHLAVRSLSTSRYAAPAVRERSNASLGEKPGNTWAPTNAIEVLPALLRTGLPTASSTGTPPFTYEASSPASME